MARRRRYTEEQRVLFDWLAKEMRLKSGLDEYLKERLVVAERDRRLDSTRLPIGRPRRSWDPEDQEAYATFLEFIRDARRLYRAATKDVRAQATGKLADHRSIARIPYSELQEVEGARAEAEALLVGHAASCLPDVRAFWTHWFGDTVLSPLDAIRVINRIKRDNDRDLVSSVKWAMALGKDDPMGWWAGDDDPGRFIAQRESQLLSSLLKLRKKPVVVGRPV